MTKIKPVPISQAQPGDYVTALDLLSAGARFWGDKYDRKDGKFKFAQVLDMTFQIEHGHEGAFYRRIQSPDHAVEGGAQ